MNPTPIDDYLARVPEPARTTLEKVRKAIRAAAPNATEVISYQAAAFRMKRVLVSFAAYPKHCSFFVMSHAVMKQLEDEVKPYRQGAATLRFPLHKPLPAALVKKIVKARIAETGNAS